MKHLLFAIFALTYWSAEALESVKADHIQVSILAPKQFGSDKTTIGFRYATDPGWHIYWKNPGDSGAAPKFDFNPENATLGPILWPSPHRLPVGDLVNFGYEGVTVLPFEISPNKDAKEISLETKLEWLVCDIGQCLPGFATLKVVRPVGAIENWQQKDKAELDANLARVPIAGTNSKWKIKSLTQQGDLVTVTIEGSGDLSQIDLFPTDGLMIRPQAPVRNKNQFVFQLLAGQTSISSTGFVLSDQEKSWEWQDLKVLPANFEPTTTDFTSFLILLLSSFIGGIILNLMPCVLPVLSIKFLSISQASPADRAKEALLYTAGVLVTFSFLGGIFLALRSGGASVGWGFQLQSPPVVLGLVILFWVMALNFLGVFEFGTGIMNAAGKSRHNGAFAAGVLSVFIAAPCTGPFMGTALGAAAVLPAIEAMAIFISLGLGLASPFALVAFSPQARRLIPRPGAWMEKLKEFFAFPLIATVIWLLWVLHLQVGVDALPSSLGILLLLSFSFWWGKKFRKGLVPVWIATILFSVYVAFDFNKRASEPTAQVSENWQTFTPEKVTEARAQGKSVFIDFTAAWCITCQFNKKTVLRTKSTETLFKEKGVVLFEADWTRQDSVITKTLGDLGRNSVPVYVFYSPGSKDAKILPQILTPSVIEGLFE